MKNIISFLETYEKEQLSQIDFIDKSIKRLNGQIRDLQKSIREKKSTIDSSYNMFSASQSNNEVDTEISTFYQIIEDKKCEIDKLKNKKIEVSNKLEEIKSLNYHSSGGMITDGFLDKLILIRKFFDVDVHRAKSELDKLIANLEDRKKGEF